MTNYEVQYYANIAAIKRELAERNELLKQQNELLKQIINLLNK